MPDRRQSQPPYAGDVRRGEAAGSVPTHELIGKRGRIVVVGPDRAARPATPADIDAATLTCPAGALEVELAGGQRAPATPADLRSAQARAGALARETIAGGFTVPKVQRRIARQAWAARRHPKESTEDA